MSVLHTLPGRDLSDNNTDSGSPDGEEVSPSKRAQLTKGQLGGGLEVLFWKYK